MERFSTSWSTRPLTRQPASNTAASRAVTNAVTTSVRPMFVLIPNLSPSFAEGCRRADPNQTAANTSSAASGA